MSDLNDDLYAEDLTERFKIYQDEQILSNDPRYLTRKSSDLADALKKGFQEDIETWYPLIDFDTLRYRELPVTRGMHDVPRFGNSRDFAVVVTGNERDVDAYILGLHVVAITSWVFFALW